MQPLKKFLAAITIFLFILLGMVSAQYLRGQRTEAQSNSPPVIVEPSQASYSVTEGDALVIPFTVSEPDNDVVAYSVQYLVGGVPQSSLPTGAVFETDGLTAERRLVWWPSLSQEGLYIFRFTAVDDKGLAAEKTVRVTVQDRIGAPAIKVTKAYPMVDYYEGLKKPLVVDPVVIEEGSGPFTVLVETFDPEGESVSVDFAGIPKATVTPSGNGYIWKWFPGYPPDSRPNVGLYTGQITATDASGNKTTSNFTLEVRRVWNYQEERVYVRPQARGGLVRTIDTMIHESTKGVVKVSIVQGSVTFGLESTLLWDSGPFPFPKEARYRYILHTPDANGNDVKTYLSDILTGPQEITWDSRTLADGTYALDIELLDGGTTPESEINRFRARPLFVIADNAPGPVAGQQWLPNTGFAGTKDLWYEPTAVQWIRFSGSQEQATIHPYPYHVVPAPTTDAERHVLAANNQWFAETWLKPWNARYYMDPGFFRTHEGHLVVTGVNWDGLQDVRYSEWFPETDGGRNQVSLADQITLRPDPLGPGFLGIGLDGRLVKIDPTDAVNVVKTLAGWVTRSDVVPFLLWDDQVTLDQRHQEQGQLIGSFKNNLPFKNPLDLAIDPVHPNLIYVADSGNHRIALVDRSGPQVVITTFAGKPATVGYANGTRQEALFNDPTSVEIIGRTLYVVDRGNFALRAIDLDTGQVTTPVGKGPNAPAVPDRDTVRNNMDAWTSASVSFDDAALVYPRWIRRYSNGDLLLEEAPYPYNWTGGGNLRRIRFGKGRVDQLVTPAGKPIRLWSGHAPALPDWQGNVRPVDEVLTAGNNDTAHGIYRIGSDGSVVLLISSDDATLYPARDTEFARGTGGAYPVGGLVIDDKEARFAFTGQQQSGLVVLRPLESSDPDPNAVDFTLSSRGRDLYLAGTILDFFPSAFRPSLASLHGRMGFNRFGNISQFDDLVSMSDAELAAYIQAGMAGKIERPEITGKDLQALIYFIRVHSIRGKFQAIDKNSIAQNLKNAGYWDKLTDTSLAEIRSVQTFTANNTARLVFKTDEPTICLTKYGPTDYYGLASSIEPASAKDHDFTINTQLSKKDIDTHHFSLLYKDQAGNLTNTKDKLMTGADAPPPPIVNKAPVVNVGSDQTITLPNDASLNATVSDDNLPDPPKQVTVSWSKVSGPGTVTFSDATKKNPTASFSIDGTYILRLTASDSVLSSTDDIQITVQPIGSKSLLLTITSDFRDDKKRNQDFSRVRVKIIEEVSKQVVLNKVYSSNTKGEIVIPEADLTNVKNNKTTDYTIITKIIGHIATSVSNKKDLFNQPNGFKFKKAFVGDFNDDGKVDPYDINILITFFQKNDMEIPKEIFKTRPSLTWLIKTIFYSRNKIEDEK